MVNISGVLGCSCSMGSVLLKKRVDANIAGDQRSVYFSTALDVCSFANLGIFESTAAT